ncbi:MAG: nitrous oxide reductase accessory protein NosL [Saprospiraceae bacterium]|nr:nitrous oxide reductase accessory protein NosL [Saprospiraceae bacterium]
MKSFPKSSVILLIVAGLCILSAVYFPIWRIELDAPQYPEGLALLIYANRMGGEVEIINGLNHYIGMKTLHAEEFIEFTVLPDIIGFFVLWSIATGLFLKSKKSVLVLLIVFAAFGVLAMYDFWRWEYEYGHNLDPTAAIIVPGMAYQPPLIGFKQLLNFGAFSIPDTGGWLMLLGGLLIGFVYLQLSGFLNRSGRTKSINTLIFLVPLWVFSSCASEGPQKINLHSDTCAFCKMNISEGHFAAQILTKKGRYFHFDDITCMVSFNKENPDKEVKNFYVHNYPGDNELIPAETAFYIKGGSLKSPMAGDIAAFKTEAEAEEYRLKTSAERTDWNQIKN